MSTVEERPRRANRLELLFSRGKDDCLIPGTDLRGNLCNGRIISRRQLLVFLQC